MKKTPLNTGADISSKAKGLNVGLSLHLLPNFVNESSLGSDDSVSMHRLVRAFAGGLYNWTAMRENLSSVVF